MHTSIKLDCPVEFINITPLNPLISKCQIKVCYVSDKPNRNKSIITKEVAKQMANSLPGCPIVGFYNEGKGDFEEHNRIIDISNGKFEIKDTTRPYGFVDLGAKVWFQKFLDDGDTEREYMMTEGWLWTGQYPECQRILDQGNNQSMELDEKTLNAAWTKGGNGKPKFFIINEAIISKLCTLGQDNEPCFEGSSITAPIIQFAFEDGFKEQLVSMMSELKDLLNEGGEKVFTTYAVEIGDSLWNSLYSYLEQQYPVQHENNCCCGSIYRVEGIFEEENQKFAILQNRNDGKYFRMNFSLTEEGGFVATTDLVEVTKTYTPASEPQFALDAVEAFELEYAKKKKEAKDNDDEEDEKCLECGKPKSECTCDDDEDADEDDEKKKKKGKKSKYNLEEIQEYVELSVQYSNLETEYSNAQTRINELEEEVRSLSATKENLESQVSSLTTFKNGVEKKEKEAMIASFYMLSDEDKADVVANIDTYSLDDIEAKLSIICVRNKVSFNLDDEHGDVKPPVVFGLDHNEDEAVPAWVQALRRTAANN